MKITIFVSGVTGGGAEKVACAAASFFVNRGYEVDLLTMSDEPPTYPVDNKVLRICLLHEDERKNFICNNAMRFLRFLRYLIFNRPNVYLAMLPTNICALLFFKFLARSKVVALERNNPSSYKSKVQEKLKRLCNKADGWIFQTTEQQSWYRSRAKLKKDCVIPNAINVDILKQRKTEVCTKTIVTAGRLTDQKNHKLLISAFAKIADKHMDYNLVIYGEGPNRTQLEEQIAKLNLKNRILLPGYSSDVMANVSKASLFVLSSDYEGMPNALMEAMALGVPCISTDCGGGGARFLIDNGKNGLLVPVKDVDALANAMDMILSNKTSADSLGEEAHKLCKALSPKTIYGLWEKFIEEIINQ